MATTSCPLCRRPAVPAHVGDFCKAHEVCNECRGCGRRFLVDARAVVSTMTEGGDATSPSFAVDYAAPDGVEAAINGIDVCIRCAGLVDPDAKYTLDGEPDDLDDYMAEYDDSLSLHQEWELLTLKVGDGFTCGGCESVLRRIS